MRSFDALERGYAALPPAGSGAVRLIVVRTGDGQHATPAQVELSPTLGLVGDRWLAAPNRNEEAHISFIDTRVASLLAGGDPSRLHLPGDNFHVDLALDEASLRVGTRFRLGSALVEISPKPHFGCAKFRARLGDGALAWVNEPAFGARRLRGVYARILEPGTVQVGDALKPC